MLAFDLKPDDDILDHYFSKVKTLEQREIVHERAVSPYFGLILDHCAERFGKGKITFTFDFKQERQGHSALFPDGALIWNENSLRVPFAFWEAKDSEDDLLQACQAKFAVGYPKSNILFQSPKEILLIQDGKIVLHEKIVEDTENSRRAIIAALKQLFEYDPPFAMDIKLIASFGETIGKLGAGMVKTLQQAYRENTRFSAVFNEFAQICREVLNPNIRTEAIQEMLIQHLLTVRIFNTVFNHPEFVRHNIIACKIEEVIEALKPPLFDRYHFLEQLDQFYTAIERTSDYIFDFFHKQSFLNVIYERFFQGFAVKVADTHGIVYTPQPVVEFMVKSVEVILQREFGKSLASPQVPILDPFVGTGNFMVRVLQEIQAVAGEDDKVLNELKEKLSPRELAQLKSDYQRQKGLFKNKSVEEADLLYQRQVQRLQDRYIDILHYKYLNELHCNEVMLLPYYIACVNIEHAFSALCETTDYQSFEGICLVDTFGIDEPQQGMIGEKLEENVGRVENQRQSSIFVIIGNPPYNAGQINENDNNKNRKYQIIDEEVRKTYAKHSKATLRNALSDPYVKAIRWATNRIKDEGIVAFITNNSFLDGIAFDGMRKCLEMDFAKIYILDLGGNVRKNPKLSGTKHNVFGIQVGVSINFFIKKKNGQETGIFYAEVGKDWTKLDKYAFLQEKENISHILWQSIHPSTKNIWLTQGLYAEFDDFIPLGTKEEKSSKTEVKGAIFKIYSRGVITNGDAYLYNFDKQFLCHFTQSMVENYNAEVKRWWENNRPENIEEFLQVDETKLKWIRHTKRSLQRILKDENGDEKPNFLEFDNDKIRVNLYRPFCKQHYYFERIFNEDTYHFPRIFPNSITENENQVICLSAVGNTKTFHCLMVNVIPDLHLTGDSQCFPFYIYAEDGTNRQENISDWALTHFQQHYQQETLTKWDLFYYIYGLLHHPRYQEKYAANLKRELPRIPLIDHFWDFSHAGRQLAELHLHYDQQPEYPLDLIHDGKIDWELKDKMRLSKDKTQINYNYSLTLSGIPAKIFNYRLGNRSALEWIIERYQVKTDDRSQITNNPNQLYEPKAIVKLIGQIITVSLKTVEIVEKLPEITV